MKVVKIGAVWCAGCIVMKPTWKELEEQYQRLDTEYFDYDQDLAKIGKYNIDWNLPCFIFLDKNGKEIERMQWEFPKSLIEKKIFELKDK